MAEPIIVVGAGFVPYTGIAGIYGNNTVPPQQQEEGAPVLPAQDAPDALSLPSEVQAEHLAVAPAPSKAKQPLPPPSSESSGE